MSKEDTVAREDAGCLAYRASFDAPGKGTLRGVIEDATSCMDIGVAGEVMPGELFSTPLVRPPSGGQRAGHRSKVGDNLPSTS